jgi:hypothetical protein
MNQKINPGPPEISWFLGGRRDGALKMADRAYADISWQLRLQKGRLRLDT